MEPLHDVITYYERFAEESRLDSGPARLELERTMEILAKVLPKPPGRVIDVGGAGGRYSAWLAERGHEVHMVDVSPRLVEQARQLNAKLSKPITSLSVADVRGLPQPDGFAAAVLLMGPLYHLTSSADRQSALSEALRVLKPSGLLVVAAISRYASALDGLARELAIDPAFVQMRDQDLRDGQHRNNTERPDYFTTAFFHRPEDIRAELDTAGFQDVDVFGVEGPGWIVSDFERRWADEELRGDIMNVARALESEPSILGASAHLLAIGRKAGT
jgi:ubiquinone/menaquinone biosynthesis C-methylase UbiE